MGQGLFINTLVFVKDPFIGASVVQALLNHGRYVFSNLLWVVRVFMYIDGGVSSFLYGSNVSVSKCRVTSKKSVLFIPVSIVMLKPRGLSSLWNPFLMLSNSLFDLLMMPNPSSR